jgi:DNA-binding transcriptional regulator LsrR (DeoR family)
MSTIIASTTTTTNSLPTISQMIEAGLVTKVSQIRYLDSKGFTRSEIAKHLNIIYQHVRNELLRVPKKAIEQPTIVITTAKIESMIDPNSAPSIDGLK